MHSRVRQFANIDDTQLYLAKGTGIMPDLYLTFIEDLAQMERMGRVSLVPITIFQQFHFRLSCAC